jgi:tetratricopeptide (TPR) repeat protein
MALVLRPQDATAAFNLGVALEDLARPAEAVAAYERALRADPDNADAHFNVSRLLERAGRKAAALRHLKAYRSLIRS